MCSDCTGRLHRRRRRRRQTDPKKEKKRKKAQLQAALAAEARCSQHLTALPPFSKWRSMITSGFEMCLGPSTLAKPRVESRIKKFAPSFFESLHSFSALLKIQKHDKSFNSGCGSHFAKCASRRLLRDLGARSMTSFQCTPNQKLAGFG